MINRYWQFLNWLSAHKMYYLAWVIYHVNLIIGLVIFAVVLPVLYLIDFVMNKFKWITVLYKQGIEQLKKGRK